MTFTFISSQVLPLLETKVIFDPFLHEICIYRKNRDRIWQIRDKIQKKGAKVNTQSLVHAVTAWLDLSIIPISFAAETRFLFHL